MSQKTLLSLGQMQVGQSGTIMQVLGGRGLAHRLEAMGVRPGKKVTKIGALFRGPVTLKVDHTQVALGFGMASKILVEVEPPS
jgi:ferrous iron transport protein A